MAVEKMTFLNITGPIDELDSFVYNTIIPNEIQLVKALSILDTVKGVYPYTETNPYESILKQMDDLGIRPDYSKAHLDSINKAIDLDGVQKRLDQYDKDVGYLRDEKQSLIEGIEHKDKIRMQILPIRNLDIEVDKLFTFDHMKFRFGKMPIDSFNKLQDYIEKVDIIYYEVYKEDEEIYLVYFTPGLHQETNDSLFASLHFTRIRISDEVKGYPKDAIDAIENEILDMQRRIEAIDHELNAYFDKHRIELSLLYVTIENLNQVFNVRELAVHSREAFYLTGWIPANNLADFDREIARLDNITHLVEQDDAVKKSKPPTKLRNIGFMKPFEAIVGLYGTPSYNELDPTLFVGITYLLMFAIMFGDVGQGFVIGLAAWFIYKKTGMILAKLGIYLGGMSMISGFMYGSVFANEELLPELFKDTHLHFFHAMDGDNMMVVLGGAVGFGILLLIIAMIFNLINAYKNRDMGRFLFDKNGIIGMVFYFSILYIAGTQFLVQGDNKPTALPAIFLIIVSLVVILLSHPLQNWIRKKKKIFPDNKGGFFIESTFEVIEVILSVVSNTISFIRIGAFAMNHVGFSMAFQGLSRMVAQANEGITGTLGSILVMVIGNIIIIVLEGMIVAIQCMRLSYYELFSRFFEGGGTPFKPYSIKKNQEA